MPRPPTSVLFACTTNSVRSPMAEVILKSLHGRRIYVDSAGIRSGEPDAFAQAVMQEVGLDLARHRPKSFEELDAIAYDLVISLSPEAQHRAVELTRTAAVEIEFWHIFDPTAVWGTRDQRLVAYRSVRDELTRRIRERFPLSADAADAGPGSSLHGR